MLDAVRPRLPSSEFVQLGFSCNIHVYQVACIAKFMQILLKNVQIPDVFQFIVHGQTPFFPFNRLIAKAYHLREQIIE